MAVSLGSNINPLIHGKPRVIEGERIAQHQVTKRIERIEVYPSGQIEVWTESGSKAEAVFHRTQLPFSTELEFSAYLDIVHWDATQSAGHDEYFITASVGGPGGGAGNSTMGGSSKLSDEMKAALKALQEKKPDATVTDLLCSIIPQKKWWPSIWVNERKNWNIKWVEELLAAGADPNAVLKEISMEEYSYLVGAPILWVVCNSAIQSSSRKKTVIDLVKLLVAAGAKVDVEFHGKHLIEGSIDGYGYDYEISLFLLKHLLKSRGMPYIFSTGKRILSHSLKGTKDNEYRAGDRAKIRAIFENDEFYLSLAEPFTQAILMKLPKNLLSQIETLKLVEQLKREMSKFLVFPVIVGVLSKDADESNLIDRLSKILEISFSNVHPKTFLLFFSNEGSFFEIILAQMRVKLEIEQKKEQELWKQREVEREIKALRHAEAERQKKVEEERVKLEAEQKRELVVPKQQENIIDVGVQKNLEEKVKMCRMAADQGDANAQCLLGLLYANGDGVPKDLQEAATWYRKAADQGDADAQRLLAGLQA